MAGVSNDGPAVWKPIPRQGATETRAAAGIAANGPARLQGCGRALGESGTNWARRLWLAGGSGWPCLVCRVGVHPSTTHQVPPAQAPDPVALAA